MLSEERVSTNFSLLHINARSLSKNKDHLSLYLSTLKTKFGVIAVIETWASADIEALLSIPGYNSVFKNRLQNRGGGVALFISNTFNFTECEDLNAFSCNDFASIL